MQLLFFVTLFIGTLNAQTQTQFAFLPENYTWIDETFNPYQAGSDY